MIFLMYSLLIRRTDASKCSSEYHAFLAFQTILLWLDVIEGQRLLASPNVTIDALCMEIYIIQRNGVEMKYQPTAFTYFKVANCIGSYFY